NPPIGALITYYLRDDAPAGAKYILTVTDAAGKQMRQLDASAKSGLHRTPWDLRETPPPPPQQQQRPANPTEPADPDAEAQPAGSISTCTSTTAPRCWHPSHRLRG